MTRQRITPSLVISIIALIVALGGVSYAAIQIPRNSVGTKQLKKNAVNTAKVRNGTLLRSDFRSGQLPGATWFADRSPVVPLLVLTNSFQNLVITPKLPAGSYVLSARANLAGAVSASSVICSLENDAAQNFTVGAGEGFALAMSATAVLQQPKKIELNCLTNGAGFPSVAQAHIIATRVTRVIGGGS